MARVGWLGLGAMGLPMARRLIGASHEVTAYDPVTASLEAGVALFVDYGYPRREYYLPQRGEGTLVCHYRHRAHADPLLWPGLTDISAFVDFTALAEAGVGAGFDFVGYAPQGQFLLASGLPELLETAPDAGEPERLRLVGEALRLELVDPSPSGLERGQARSERAHRRQLFGHGLAGRRQAATLQRPRERRNHGYALP